MSLMQYLSSVYYVNKILHVSGTFVAHHLEVYCLYTVIGTCRVFQLTVCWPAGRPANRQSTGKHNKYHLLYTHSIPPDDGLKMCPKHVEFYWRNKLRINIASSWFLLHRSNGMQSQQNIKPTSEFHRDKENITQQSRRQRYSVQSFSVI